MAILSNDTAFYNAARDGKYEIILDLIPKHNVDVNRVGPNNNTPLHIAAMNGHGAIVQLLVGYGCSRFTKNDQGSTPAELAKTTKIKNLILYPKRGSTERFAVEWQDVAPFRGDHMVIMTQWSDGHWLGYNDPEDKDVRIKVAKELSEIYHEFGEQAKKLIKASDLEWYKAMIKMYTAETPLYKRMNKDIAAMNKLTKFKFYARELHKALCYIEQKENKIWKGFCYRSLKLSEDKVKLFEKKSKGGRYDNLIELPSFASFSKSKQFCLGWGGNVLLVCKPFRIEGIQPTDISHLSVFSGEQEVLFSYVNQFMVLEVKSVNYANSKIKWEIILETAAEYV